MMRWLIGGIVGLLLMFIAAVALDAYAAAPATQPTPGAKAALAVTDRFIIAHYRALAEAADFQVRTWHDVCGKPLRGREAMLRGAYASLADRWAEVEFIKTGPMTLFFRHERFNYWPEQRNATARGLETLLASSDPKALSPVTLAHDSIPAQGLPALERLIYESQYERHPRRCAVGEGIARNLAAIAHDVLNAWAAPNGLRAAIAANRPWNNGMVASADDAARMLLTDLVSAFTAINDQKLLAPMGAGVAQAKPKLVEAWRSGRGQLHLISNIQALRAMTAIFAAGITAPQRQKIDAAFAAAETAVKPLPPDIGAAVADSARRSKLVAARAAIKSAQTVVAATLPVALKITLGFNSLDGD